MATRIIEESERSATRVAGILYILTMLAANFTEFFVRGRLNVPGDALQTARNIAVSGQLFRIGIAGDLITLVGDVALAAALFMILKPINRNLALVAAFWWLVECSIAAVTIVINYASLLLLSGAGPIAEINAGHLPELARFVISLDTAGSRIAALCFGLGSTVFCYLWFRSRYIPRSLAAWGILASLVPTIVPFATMMLPTLQDVYLRRARTGSPIVIFEVVLGLWLVVRGKRTTEGRKERAAMTPRED